MTKSFKLVFKLDLCPPVEGDGHDDVNANPSSAAAWVAPTPQGAEMGKWNAY